MPNKDFLSSLSEDKKPDSFKEEERVKVVKQKSPYTKYVVLGVIGAVIISLLVYIWIFLIPHIGFKDFTNKKAEEVQAYLTQNKIESQGIVFFEEYNFDIEKGYIISQSVAGDKKIHKNEKITFYVSKGADPNERVNVPELETMNRKQIESWITDNKLQNVKISTAFSDEIEKDEIISVVFKNDDRLSFSRGSAVTITFSKGKPEANTLKVIDLKDQTYAAAEAFAKEKKLNITKVEILSTEIEKGMICYTKPAANENIKEGETLTVYVSKGKAIVVPDLVGKTEDDFNIFVLGDGKYAVTYKKYVETDDMSLDGVIKEQSIKAGTKITDEVFVVTFYRYEKGVETVTLPEFKTLEDFNNWMTVYGYNLNPIIEEVITDDKTKEGIIVSQYPVAGTKVVNETVIIKVYKTPIEDTSVELKSVVGQNIEDAKTYLNSLGITVYVTESKDPAPSNDLINCVKDQSLPEGTKIYGFEEIKLTIWTYTETE